MKNCTLILSIVLSSLMFFGTVNGQVNNDPIVNIYKVGGSSEIFIAYSTTGNVFSKQGVLDVPENLNDITTEEESSQYKHMNIRKTASAVGDFNGDGKDEVVSIRDNISGGIKITIPLIGADLTLEGEREFVLDELNENDYKHLRICVGNFDADIADEFVICYAWPGETVKIVIFETDEELNITQLDYNETIAYFDYHFDITAGDVDGDGTDEIVMVKNEAVPWEANTGVNPPIFISEYDLYIFEYNTGSNKLTKIREVQNIQLDNASPSGDNYGWLMMNEMRVSCGDLNSDGRDEIVVGFSLYFSHYRYEYCSSYFLGICIGYSWRYYFNDMVFLNTFMVSSPSGEIENIQNMFVTRSDLSTRGSVAGQQIALSLKCEQLDNIGSDEVLVNGAAKFCVLGSVDGTMELEKRVELAATGGYLNIQGNEAFVVADLNPDTAKMDFNKEVVLLLSSRNQVEQMNKVPDVPGFEILVIDTINSDTLAFLTPGPPYDLPFTDVDIEVSALATGDFDLDRTDLYMIGTPEVFSVSELQYPLVILNAPPVHFDILNGVTHDLCDAFLGEGEPAFSALYNTKVDDINTTSVEVTNSMGFSSEFSMYAMAGGSGFEMSVNKNYESGISYYKEKSQNTFIEEEKKVYTEDYVLYSSLDYTYYRYPIFNEEHKEIGKIAVLNPESNEFRSVWGSGNSWEHPGYIFNHEPGNILSYKPYRNSIDFCPRICSFSFYEFSRVPVTNTGDGSFKFTFENISNQSGAFSFSSSVGSDLFTKVGFEGTATVNLGAFGIGGSISTDIRIGVSSDLSSHYSRSALNSHTTELRDAFQIDGTIGRLNENYDNVARYFITPYIYRSQSGALVLDYMIDLDDANKEWWVDNYGQNPDLAFILPWKYATEKGSENIKPSKKQKTSEIQFYPPLVSPGDTVCITTRVHNYSLATFDNTLKVDYYLGDPDFGGVKLTDIYGESGSSKNSVMIYGASEANLDFEEYLTFNWKVPDTVSCSPRIYAVIDPEDEYVEIHENNNKGWNTLRISECADCQYTEHYVDVEDFNTDLFRFETFPNPVSTFSNVRFSLPWPDKVTIDLFDMAGHKVATVTDRQYPAGEQMITFNTEELGGGVYFYQVKAGGYATTAKLIVLK